MAFDGLIGPGGQGKSLPFGNLATRVNAGVGLDAARIQRPNIGDFADTGGDDAKLYGRIARGAKEGIRSRQKTWADRYLESARAR